MRIVQIFGAAGVTVALAAGTLYGFARASWVDGLLSGIAVGMSLLPEEFPLVLTVFMVMGAWRIAQARVLTRRAAAIETLGSVTVLCSDKTGTLTQNRMEVAHVEAGGAAWRVDDAAPPEPIRRLVHVAMLAGLPDPFDPMERAIQTVVRGAGRVPEAVFAEHELTHRQGVTPELLAMIQVWRQEGGGKIVATKGAPEAVFALCALPAAERARLLERTNELAAEGLRVLAVAEAATASETPLADVSALTFSYLGLIGFRDPVRESVPAAVRECAAAGIRVIMITGDYPETARAIAKEAGLNASETLTGSEMKQLDDEALRKRLRTCDVFARILPEQKLRLVELLKANGEVVGMTGDGVNDAPSLRAAHIGIAMGGRGTDVAREASSIVLLDDDFGSIVKTIRLGRRIYDTVEGHGVRRCGAYSDRGLALLPLARSAADHDARDRRVPGDGDRSGLLDCFRGRAGGAQRDEPAATRPAGAAATRTVGVFQLHSRTAGVAWCRGGLCCRALRRSGRRRHARLDACFSDARQRFVDLQPPLASCVRTRDTRNLEPLALVRSWRRCGAFGNDAFAALASRSVSPGATEFDDLPFCILSLAALAVALLIAKRWPADAVRRARSRRCPDCVCGRHKPGFNCLRSAIV
jgi:phosphoserine phosphatase